MNTDSVITYDATCVATADTACSDAPGDPLQQAVSADLTGSSQTEDAKHGCRRFLHRQEVSCCSRSSGVSVAVDEAGVDVEADVEADVDVDVDVKRTGSNTVYETLADEADVQPQNIGSPSNANPEPAAGAQAGSRKARMCNCSIEDLDAEDTFQAKLTGRPKPGRSRTPAQFVKHTEPNELLALERLLDPLRVAFLGFLTRYGQNTWMQAQANYAQKAAIAAAHVLMGMWRSYGQHVDYPGQWTYLQIDDFEVVDYLNCGWSCKPKKGSPYFEQCRQPEYCPSCNYQLRVKPARREFLPAFRSAPLWYGITLMATSDPAKAGVKMFAGCNEDGKPVYEPLVMLSEMVDWPKLPKYDSQ